MQKLDAKDTSQIILVGQKAHAMAGLPKRKGSPDLRTLSALMPRQLTSDPPI